MSELHTERMIQRGRVVALVVAAGLVVAFGSDRSLGMTLAVVVLCATIAGTALALRHARGRSAVRLVGLASFGADVVVCALALSAVSQDPIDPVGMITFLIGVEAALRWGRTGAIVGGTIAGVLAVAWAASGYEAIGRELPATSIAFRLLSNVVLALPVGQLIGQLRTEQSHARRLFEYSNEAILMLTDGRIANANPAAAELAGRPLGQLLHRPLTELFEVHGSDAAAVDLPGSDAAEPVRSVRGSTIDTAGQQRWLSFDSVVDDAELNIVIVRDVTDETQQALQLRLDAHFDPVTGLHNRVALRTTLAERLPADDLGLVFLDLDDFKLINDRYGHTVGDRLLEEVARRLQGVTRGDDVAYRWAGDEFCVIVHAASPAVLASMAERIERALEPPVDLDGIEIVVEASAGTAMAHPDDDEMSLIHRADGEMYQRKGRRKQQRER